MHTITGAYVCLGCLPAYYLARNNWRQGLTAKWSVATAAPLGSFPVREAGRGSEVVPWRGLGNWGGQLGKKKIKYTLESQVIGANKNVEDWEGCCRMTFLWPECLGYSCEFLLLLCGSKFFFFNSRCIQVDVCAALLLGCLCQMPHAPVHFLQPNKRQKNILASV